MPTESSHDSTTMKWLRPSRLCGTLAAAGLTVLSACAINPRTGQPELSPSVSARFTSIFNNANPCSNNDRNIGAVLGGAAGALVGHYLIHGRNKTTYTLMTTAVGAFGGGLIGHWMDARRCRLYKIAKANHLAMASAVITPANLGEKTAHQKAAIGLDVELRNNTDEFAPGSAVLKPRARAYLAQIAQQYNPEHLVGAASRQKAAARRRVVLIVGHTDAEDAAASGDLARLSQERAKAVAEIFAENGVPPSHIYYQGAGDVLPIESNATAQGRKDNNRVQIVDVPTLSDLQRYLQRRSANPLNYKTTLASANSAPQTPTSPEETTARASHPTVAQRRTGRAPEPVAVTGPRHPPTRHPVAATEIPHHSHVSPAVAHSSRRAPRSAFNFGGQPVRPPGPTIDLGSPIEHSTFHLVSTANASVPVVIGSCLKDHPDVATPVRNLRTGKDLPPRDFVRGFYGTVWDSYINGNLVAVTHATVPLDAGVPVPQPEVYVYKNYRRDPHPTPDLETRAFVNVYRGTEKMVYRVFLKGPVRCLDIIVPTDAFDGRGDLYYGRRADEFRAKSTFAMK